jgi:hypothetical protein
MHHSVQMAALAEAELCRAASRPEMRPLFSGVTLSSLTKLASADATEAPRKERRANADELRSNMKVPPSNLLAHYAEQRHQPLKTQNTGVEGRRQPTVATSVWITS